MSSSPPSPLIRAATPADAVALGALHMACWREAYGELLSADFFARATPESSAARWSTTLSSVTESHALVVAEGPAGLVGFAMSGPSRIADAPRALELYAVYIRASEYGTGLGDRLLATVLADQPAYLWVLERNPRAIAFYERCGFRRDGSTETLADFENLVEVRLVR